MVRLSDWMGGHGQIGGGGHAGLAPWIRHWVYAIVTGSQKATWLDLTWNFAVEKWKTCWTEDINRPPSKNKWKTVLATIGEPKRSSTKCPSKQHSKVQRRIAQRTTRHVERGRMYDRWNTEELWRLLGCHPFKVIKNFKYTSSTPGLCFTAIGTELCSTHTHNALAILNYHIH